MLYVQQLSEKIKKLSEVIPLDFDFDTLPLKERVILVYRITVIQNLKYIIDSNSGDYLDHNLAARLEFFLKENWLLINGTCLSYSILQDETALLLFEIADDIADFRQKTEEQFVPLLNLLMPGVSLESLAPSQYPHLLEVSSKELPHLFRSFFLGKGGAYLIPVKLLLRLNEHAPEDSFKNYYFDFENHPSEYAFLDEFEQKKLVHQSLEAEEYFNAVVDYNDILLKGDSLYCRLEILWKHLYYYSKNIAGKEEIPGKGIYNNLLYFIDYYDRLEPWIKDKIPQSVREQIHIIIKVSTEPSGIDACLAKRQEELREAITGNEDNLKQLTLSTGEQKEISPHLEKRIFESKKKFESALNGEDYQCNDPLGLTYQLLNKLNITINLVDFKALKELIITLSPEEISSLCQDKNIREEIIFALEDIENLVTLMTIDMSHLQLENFIFGLKNELINPEDPRALIQRTEDLLALLIFLTPRALDIVLNVFKDNLGTLTCSTTKWITLLRPFTKINQFSVICNILKDQICSFFDTSYDLGMLLEALNHNQRIILFESIKEEILKLIKDPVDIIETAKYFKFKEENYKVLLHFLISNSLAIFKSQEHFNFLLDAVNPSYRFMVFDFVKNQLPIPKSIQDFHRFLSIFESHENEKNLVFDCVKNWLPTLIQSSEDFPEILKPLNKFCRIIAYNTLKKYFDEFIQSPQDFCNVLLYLPLNQKIATYRTLNPLIFGRVESAEDFCSVIFPFKDNPLIKKELYEIYEKVLPRMVLSAANFNNVLLYLNEDDKSKFYKRVKVRLPGFISTAENFYFVFYYLDRIQKAEIYKNVKNRLPTIIKSINGLLLVLSCLNTIERMQAYEILKPYFFELVKSTHDLYRLLRIPYFNDQQRNEIKELSSEWSFQQQYSFFNRLLGERDLADENEIKIDSSFG